MLSLERKQTSYVKASKKIFQCLSFLNSGFSSVLKVRMFACASLQLDHVSRRSYLFMFQRNFSLKKKSTTNSL